MQKKKMDCVSCGKEFEIERDELHEAGFPHPPTGAGSIHVSVKGKETFGNSFWASICPDCGDKFCEASKDPVVLQALVDLLGWYVRQAIDLKKAVSSIKENLA